MKKIFLSVSIITIAISSNAQKITKDSLIKLMSNDVCIELNKMISDKKQITNLDTELGMAMIPAYSKYINEIKEIYGFDDISEGDGEIVGRDIGMQLVKVCPAFIQILRNNSEATSELISGKKNSKSNYTVEGTLLKIGTNDFSFIEIKTSTGKVEKLLWLEYFEGSNILVNEPLKMINKSVMANYIEKEIFKPALKDYIKVKVITGIQLN
jgi:hypothetical protein